MIVIFNSHRARQKAERLLDKTPVYLYSFEQETGRGCCDLTLEDYEKIKDVTGVRLSKKLKLENLSECWKD